MCVTRQHILVSEHRGGYPISLGIIDLRHRGRAVAQELRVVELMSPILPSIQHKTPITQREFAISLSCSDAIRQDTTHRELALIGHNALAQIHHATTLRHDATTLFCIGSDALARPFGLHQCLQMFFGIATWQIQKVALRRQRLIRLRVKEGYLP